MAELVKVRLEKKDYTIPYEEESEGAPYRLIRITSHPINPEKLVVWRQKIVPGASEEGYHVRLTEAGRSGKGITEGKEIASIHSHVFPKGRTAKVWRFRVDEKVRGHKLAVALRETFMQRMQKRGIGKVSFLKTHGGYEETLFHLGRGFSRGVSERSEAILNPKAKLGSLRSGGLKVLWQRAKPRFARVRG